MTPNSQSNLPLGNGATPLFADPFTGAATIENKWTVLKAGTSKSPGLTASGTTTAPSGGIPGFVNPAIDAAGSGVLRLTDNTVSQSGAVIYNQSVFAKGGVAIEFEYYQYGGTAIAGKKGDGISFFLLDGTVATPTQAGGFGGGLGYAQNTVQNQGGIAGGYLGIGFDSFGNFGQDTEGRVGNGGADTADRVTVRGSASTQYKYLTGSSSAIAGGIDNDSATATRANSSRLVRVEVAGDGKLTVKFDLNGNKTFDAGENVIDGYDTVANGNLALPNSVRFGFAASTGDATNFQEIRNLSISSIADLITPGGSGSVTYTAGTAAIAVAPAVAVNPVVLTNGASNLNGATVGITPATYKTGQDFLTVGAVTGTTPAASGTFANSPLTWAFNATTGVLTISGAGTPAQYQAALAQVSYYNNAGAAANTADRVAQYILTDVPGTPSATSIIKVGAGNTTAKRPEILFQNASSGEIAIWSVDTTGVLTGAKLVKLGSNFGAAAGTILKVPGWKVIDTGDVDKDGIADILYFNPTTQQTAIHFMTNEGQIKAADFITAGVNRITLNAADQWSPVGLSDVTGDGILDITWRAAATDLIAYWTVAGTTSTALVSAGYLKAATGTADFKVGDNSKGVKMGDFDGDGKADMLLSNGKVVFFGAFTSPNLVVKGIQTLPANNDASLVVRAVGDYNVDGTTDLAWESTTADKQVLEYLKVTGGVFDPAPTNFKSLPLPGSPLAWNIGASKDFSGDLTPDLVWHNSVSGETAIWAIDKTTGGLITTGGVTAFVTLNGSPASPFKTPVGWDVVGADDFGTVTLV
jgi:hypothetical protein